MDGNDESVPSKASPRDTPLDTRSNSSQVSLARSMFSYNQKGCQVDLATDAGPSDPQPSRLDSFTDVKASAMNTSPGALSIYSQEQNVSDGSSGDVLDIDDRFPSEPPDQAQYMPKIDSLIEELQIEMMSSSDKKHIDMKFRGNILYLLADYVDTQKKLAKETKARADLAADIEGLKQKMAYFEAAREEERSEYKAEIKRLELLIHRNSDSGMQAVMLARAGRLLKKTQQSSPESNIKDVETSEETGQPNYLVPKHKRATGLGYSTFLDRPRILDPNHDVEVSRRLALGLPVIGWRQGQEGDGQASTEPGGSTLATDQSQEYGGNEGLKETSYDSTSDAKPKVPYDQTDSSESSGPSQMIPDYDEYIAEQMSSINLASSGGQEVRSGSPGTGDYPSTRAAVGAKPRLTLRDTLQPQGRTGETQKDEHQYESNNEPLPLARFSHQALGSRGDVLTADVQIVAPQPLASPPNLEDGIEMKSTGRSARRHGKKAHQEPSNDDTNVGTGSEGTDSHQQ